MKYRCCFLNRNTDEQKIVVASLSAAEVKSFENMRAAADSAADIHAEAYALRHAYADVPEGFIHYKPPQLVQ
ncbi:hypothetical protein [Bradyrhizobium genomosp. III]|uniref:hypothetical protein n=1 Tax=Bradyrhizobium genomosp. III TaxID=2683271 RepID=UPI0004B6D07D|nr:hypothetical protein [Bradyrhizobium sp. CCBAU 15635]